MSSSSKTLLTIILVVLIGVGGYFYYKMFFAPTLPETVQEAPKEYSRTSEKFDSSILPQGLPEDLPVEEGGVVVSNEIVKISNPYGKEEEQVVRSYLSTKTIKENVEIYKNYIVNKKWILSGEVEPSKDLSIFLGQDPQKPNERIKFEFSKNSITNDVMVRITLIKNI